MKDSNPPRLGDACSEGQLLRDVLRIAKEETMSAPRVTQTLARFEASKLEGARQVAAAAKPASSRRSTFHVGLGASLAIVCAISVGLYVRDGGSSAPVHSSGAVAPLAEAAPSPAPLAEATASMRVEDLPVAPPPMVRPTDERGANVRVASASSAPSSVTSTADRSAKVSAASSFQEQLALLEAARSALARGDSEGCLRTLDRYDERFRNGLFSDEIAVMRIEALAARGDRARARALGDAFLARSPDSAYASRVRSILTTTP